MRMFIILTLLILFCSSGIKAQDTVTMDLNACISYAISHSTKMKIQEADFRDAQIERRNAILAAFTPSVSGSTYVYSNFGRSIDPETNTYSQVTSFHNGYSLSAGISIFNGFQAINNIKIAKTMQQMGLTRNQQLEDQLCLAVIEAYCDVLYHTEIKKTLDTQLVTAMTSLRMVEKQAELGQKSHTDVMQLQADLAKCQYRLTSCQNALNNAFITLKDVMFWPIRKELKIDESLDNSLLSINTNQNNLDINTISEYAKHNNSKILLADANVRNARNRLKAARWQFAPSISLNGGWSSSYYTYPGSNGYTTAAFSEQIKNNGGEYIQLSLNIPIFNHLFLSSNIEKKKNDLKRASAEYQQNMQEIEAEVMRAVADRDGAADALVQAQTHARLQKEILQFNKKRFEQGLISHVEYRTIADNYLNATAEYLYARLQHFIKSYVVSYYAGERWLAIHNSRYTIECE